MKYNGIESISAEVYSGKLTHAGIEDFHQALIMLDNFGHDNVLIQNETGRSFFDENGFSETTPLPK